MGQYSAVDGTKFADDDIEYWATEVEAGYEGGHLGPLVPGRPVRVGAQARTFTLRLDSARCAK